MFGVLLLLSLYLSTAEAASVTLTEKGNSAKSPWPASGKINITSTCSASDLPPVFLYFYREGNLGGFLYWNTNENRLKMFCPDASQSNTEYPFTHDCTGGYVTLTYQYTADEVQIWNKGVNVAGRARDGSGWCSEQPEEWQLELSQSGSVTVTDEESTSIHMIDNISAVMDSTYRKSTASYAIDGDMKTVAHSKCGGKERWLELDLNAKYLVHTVKIMQAKKKNNKYRFRMDHTEVALKDTNSGAISVCGTIEIDGRAEQTYDIDCEGATGNKLKLTVSRKDGDKHYTRPCIHLNEVQVFGVLSAEELGGGEDEQP